MMSLVAEQNLKEGKDYGQECKEILMCLPRSSPKPPPPTIEEKEEKLKKK